MKNLILISLLYFIPFSINAQVESETKSLISALDTLIVKFVDFEKNVLKKIPISQPVNYYGEIILKEYHLITVFENINNTDVPVLNRKMQKIRCKKRLDRKIEVSNRALIYKTINIDSVRLIINKSTINSIHLSYHYNITGQDGEVDKNNFYQIDTLDLNWPIHDLNKPKKLMINPVPSEFIYLNDFLLYTFLSKAEGIDVSFKLDAEKNSFKIEATK
jgi:hypothetical protein